MSAARIMDTQATVPVVGLNWNARTVPTAWELVPMNPTCIRAASV